MSPNQPQTNDFSNIIADLDGGTFNAICTELLKAVAHGVIATGKKGSFSIALDIEQVGDGNYVSIKHTVP